MISVAEPTSSLPALLRQYKRLVIDLTRQLDLDGIPLHLTPTQDAARAGMTPGMTWLVKGGMLHMNCQQRRLFTWDEGDLILPDAVDTPQAEDRLTFQADAAVLLVGYDTLSLVRTLLASDDGARLWTQMLITQQAVLLRLLASHADSDLHPTPGFAYFQPGDVIIREGDEPRHVYSLFEGEADVLVDEVRVGSVSEGEVLGALALLTNSPRTATVQARTRCAVVKVPQTQFHQLIRSNPAMIQGLLTDMARQIVQLNNQVVSLSQPTHTVLKY